VPPEARWAHLKAQARQPTIGQLVDDAMAGSERDNPALQSVLPKDSWGMAVRRPRKAAVVRAGFAAVLTDELTFYDALETNDSAVKVLGDETLRTIAQELARTVRANVTHRLDAARERPRAAPRAREAHPPQVRLPAGQTGAGDPNGAGAGGAPLRALGVCVVKPVQRQAGRRRCVSAERAAARGTRQADRADGRGPATPSRRPSPRHTPLFGVIRYFAPVACLP
jgi:hypothetical protein